MTTSDAPALALAVDIGGTKVAAGVVDSLGTIRARRQAPTSDGHDADALWALVADLVAGVRSEVVGEPVVCGVGSGGPGRDRYRFVSPLNIPQWRGFPLADRLAEATGLPTHVDNDAKALALAEGWRGAATGVDDYIAMVVSTGIGGGIVLNGRLLDGADGNAGHIGHVFVTEHGRADAAGAVGNLEGQASGTAIAAITGRPPAEAPDDVRRRTGTLVGRGIASVANLLDLRLAVVSGSVALGFGTTFFDAAQAEIDRLCRLDHARGARIVPGGLGPDGPLVGAAAVGFRALGLVEGLPA